RELERDAGNTEAQRIAGTRAGDQVTHRPAAALALDVIVDQRERRRIAAALAKPGQRVQPERRPEAVGEKHEEPGTDARRDAGEDIGAPRAEVVGEEAHDEKRSQVAEVERGL